MTTSTGRLISASGSDHTKYRVVDMERKSLTSSSFGLISRFNAKYTLGKRLHLSLQFNGSFSPADMDSNSDLSYKQIRFNSTLGVGYKF